MSQRSAYVQAVIVVLLAIVIGVTLNLVRKNPIQWIAVKPKVTYVAEPIEDMTAKSLDVNSDIDASYVADSKPGEELRGLTLNQAYEIYQKNLGLFIDARQPEDYVEGHIARAICIPYDRVAQPEYSARLSTIALDKLIVVYCDGAECDAAQYLAQELISQGYKRIFVFLGGWLHWLEAGYPME